MCASMIIAHLFKKQEEQEKLITKKPYSYSLQINNIISI